MFGLNPADVMAPPMPKLWWGARAIYNPEARHAAQLIELLFDRQRFNDPQAPEKDRLALVGWISRKGLGKLRKQLRLNYVPRDANKLIWVVDGDYNLIANPKASHGYLYLGAWRSSSCPAIESSSSSPPA